METTLFFVFALASCTAQTKPTEVSIRVINAMSGRTIRHHLLYVGVGAKGLEKESDDNGVIKVAADLSAMMTLATQPYAECRAKDHEEAIGTKYSIADICSTGISSQNICGKARMQAKPGELIIFERPRPFWAFLAAPIAY